jgi:hypothetical protein
LEGKRTVDTPHRYDPHWHYEIDLELSNRRVKLPIPVPAGSAWLEIRMLARRPLLAFAHLFNPSGRFVGELSFWNETAAQPVYFGERGYSLNALAHTLEPGTYTLVCNIPFFRADWNTQQESSNRLQGSVSGGMAETEPSLAHSSAIGLQSNAVADPDGHIRYGTKRYETESRYYRGDLHGHTVYSDGKLSNEQAWSLIDERGLDFMAITEHNAISFGQPQHRALHIPAFELTLTSGHLNIFGMKRISVVTETWDRIMKEIGAAEGPNTAGILRSLREPGVLISLNHMFLSPWEFSEPDLGIDQIDTIEIICDPTYPDSPAANDKAVAFIDYLWNQGCRVYAVGGSDSHNEPDECYDGADGPSIYGDPSTWVYADGLSVETVLEALREGHAYISRRVALDITIAEGSLLPGDHVGNYGEEDSDFSYVVSLRNLEDSPGTTGYTAVFVLNSQIVQRTRLDLEHPLAVLPSVKSVLRSVTATHTAGRAGTNASWWLRFGLLDEDGHVVAYVNPIFFGDFGKCDLGIGRLIEEFGGRHDREGHD